MLVSLISLTPFFHKVVTSHIDGLSFAGLFKSVTYEQQWFTMCIMYYYLNSVDQHSLTL